MTTLLQHARPRLLVQEWPSLRILQPMVCSDPPTCLAHSGSQLSSSLKVGATWDCGTPPRRLQVVLLRSWRITPPWLCATPTIPYYPTNVTCTFPYYRLLSYQCYISELFHIILHTTEGLREGEWDCSSDVSRVNALDYAKLACRANDFIARVIFIEDYKNDKLLGYCSCTSIISV